VQQRQTGGKGTFAEYMAIEEDKVVECPAHFSKAEAAAFPLAGVTAWR
jgi:NADPH:quinone reductase-like Zn-dependent oxidoreductase